MTNYDSEINAAMNTIHCMSKKCNPTGQDNICVQLLVWLVVCGTLTAGIFNGGLEGNVFVVVSAMIAYAELLYHSAKLIFSNGKGIDYVEVDG